MALRVLGFGLQYWMVVMADNKKTCFSSAFSLLYKLGGGGLGLVG